MKRFTLLASCCLFGLLLSAQNYSYRGFIEAGDNAAARNDQYSAYKYYESALLFDDSDLELHYKMGIAAYEATAYQTAQNKLTMVAAQLNEASAAAANGEATEINAGDFPLAKYYLGHITLRQGQYDAATTYFEGFLAENPTAAAVYRESAEEWLANVEWATGEEPNPDVNLRYIGELINTPSSDYGYTVRPDGSVLYSSHNFPFTKDTLNPIRNLSRILKVVNEEMIMPLPELVNVKDKTVAHTAFNGTGSHVYYSICEYRDAASKFDEVICDIYRATIAGDGRWTEPTRLDLNMEGYSTAMPNIGMDAISGQEYLYFSSDRPGGQGQMDIYRAPITEEGIIGAPTNLADVNSAGMDVTPFFYSPRQTLFFSTDGRFTFGGLDLHKSISMDGGFSRPLNLGAPVNTSYEDAYYSQYEGQDLAYLSSNRPSAYASSYDEDSEICCYDIYEFVPDNRIDLLALTYDRLLNEDLAGATVALYEILPDGRVVLIRESVNEDGNDYNYRIDPGKVYELRASKNGYTSVIDRFDLNDPELASLGLIVRPLYLNPKIDLDVYTFNQANQEELPATSVMLYELADDGTEILLSTLSDPNSNHVEFPLDIGKRYMVKAERADFGHSTVEEVDLREFRPQGSTRMRRDLFLGQLLQVLVIDGITGEPLNNATVSLGYLDGDNISTLTNPDGNDFEYIISLDQFFVLDTRRDDYLPFPQLDTLTFTQADLEERNGVLVYTVPLFYGDLCSLLPMLVYFDNDYPNPNSLSRTTRLAYDETYYDYTPKEQIFIDSFTMNMNEDDAFESEILYNDFFDLQVDRGFDRLAAFAELLYLHLAAGNDFQLRFRGFASPRAPTSYNLNLSARRNVSIENYFNRWNNGAMSDYISNGNLEFLPPLEFGENGPDEEEVSDSYDDPQQSIYSIKASLRRRVEINGSCEGEYDSRRK